MKKLMIVMLLLIGMRGIAQENDMYPIVALRTGTYNKEGTFKWTWDDWYMSKYKMTLILNGRLIILDDGKGGTNSYTPVKFIEDKTTTDGRWITWDATGVGNQSCRVKFFYYFNGKLFGGMYMFVYYDMKAFEYDLPTSYHPLW